MDRSAAVDRVERLVDRIESETMPVPVREVWVYGEVSLGLDPIERLDVYLTKDVLLGGDSDRSDEFEATHGVKGVGRTVRGEWATEFPEYIRVNDNGYAAPEKCLAAHLTERDEPIHLEVCNASFEDNVTQRLQGAISSNDYEQILDPRGVCLWVDGRRSEEAFEKLRSGELVLPTLPEALSMLGMDDGEAREAAETLRAYRERQEGMTVRGDVV
ncbi:hypothetical protein [Halalkalicoccus sp. NIPERK01]|uniref:DUF7095 family protein n=1 Tax=Halalkalicoccus sp. NIPERK01 TaxID=3053469 RepID=UPI00256EE4AE|nr:hypothetical protein [Halalkalicoccus sp. NIPERK01]MDL5361650.1 hypothetical protein [Halalkalicoccus sp. NIPERK01]